MRDVLAAFRLHASRQPSAPAVLSGGTILSYGELARRVTSLSAWAASLPATIGFMGGKSPETIALDLALSAAGKTIVPLPDFFSSPQLAHMIADADVEAVVADPSREELAASLGLPVLRPSPGEPVPALSGQTRRIIYTSGTSGRPKGVVLGAGQMDASVAAQAQASEATAADRMLSVLPHSLLLEQIAGLALPLSVGASIALCPDLAGLPLAAETSGATATVLVPEMLAGWVAWLIQTGRQAPEGLRMVAVGGAPVPPPLAERAWGLGLPVHEGYGLSECCSVVALNRPGERKAGTVGHPLPGVILAIEDGEIVVAGPTVMEGYLGGSAGATGAHRTGDAGHFDSEGRLVVAGRLDDLIVTSTGRNIHPEWIESMLLADPRVGRCAVVAGGAHPRAVLVPAGPLPSGNLDDFVATLCASAPDYARPRDCVAMPLADLARHGLITANGRLRRRAIQTFLEEKR
jgi:long-chain acyl-CoA synthetase